jgi:hypothetical protein
MQMLSLKRIIFYLGMLSVFAGCGNPFSPNSDGKSKFEENYQPGLPDTSSPRAGPEGVKISSGSILSKGNSKAIKATVSMTDRRISGNHFAGRVSLNKQKMRSY